MLYVGDAAAAAAATGSPPRAALPALEVEVAASAVADEEGGVIATVCTAVAAPFDVNVGGTTKLPALAMGKGPFEQRPNIVASSKTS